MPDNSQHINASAQGPKKVSADGVSAEQHSVQEKIDADRYEQANKAARNGPGIRYRKFRHQGPVW